MKTKRFLALLLTMSLMLTAFTGCSGNSGDNSSTAPVDEEFLGEDVDIDINLPQNSNNENTTGNNSDGNDQTATNKDTDKVDNVDIFKNIPKSLKGTTVTIATWGDESGTEYVKVQKKFTEDTGIKVKWITYGQTEYPSKIVTQINAGKGPDIVIMNSTFPALIQATQPLPEIFNINDGFWDPRISAATSINGVNYYANSYNSPFGSGVFLFYNKSIFADNGITTPADYIERGNGKWSYEDLRQCLVDVTKVGKIGGILNVMNIAAQANTALIHYDYTKGKFVSDPTNSLFIEIMQWHAKCLEEGLVSNDYITKFASGQVGVAMTGSFGMKYNGYFKDMAPSEIGIVQLPTSLGDKNLDYLVGGNRAYGIAKGAKNPEGAYYFLRYFLDYDKYEAAGANIFSNKVMEKFYANNVLVPEYKNAKMHCQSWIDLITNLGWQSDTWKGVRNATTGQVSVELSKVKNVCNNLVNDANAKIIEYSK